DRGSRCRVAADSCRLLTGSPFERGLDRWAPGAQLGDLRREHDLVSTCKVAQRPTEHSFTLAVRVVVGRIEEVDARSSACFMNPRQPFCYRLGKACPSSGLPKDKLAEKETRAPNQAGYETNTRGARPLSSQNVVNKSC